MTSTLSVIREKYGDYPFTLHLHDTYGMAPVMVAAMGLGFASFDLADWGTPFAPEAAGNAATEDMVNTAESMGIKTGIDILNAVRTMESVYWAEDQQPPGGNEDGPGERRGMLFEADN